MRIEKFTFLFIFPIISCSFYFFSPEFFNLFEHDSKSYIEFTSERTALYPIFLNFFDDSSYHQIKIIQYSTLSLSIFFLSYSLWYRKISNILILIFFITCHLNFYYFSFSKTILTESFFFSFINFLIGFLLINLEVPKKINFFFMGSLCGLIAAVKPIGVVVLFIFVIYTLYLFVKKNYRKFHLFIFFVSLILPILVENHFYYKSHDVRNSVLHTTFIGKAFTISKETTDLNPVPEKYRSMIEKMKNESTKVETFLKDIPNLWLYSDLKSDYEVVFQSQVLKKDLVDLSSELGISTKTTFTEIGTFLIRSYPLEYLKVSLWHYFNLWSPGGKKIFFSDYLSSYKGEVPFQKELIKASGEIKYTNTFFLLISLILFNLTFFIHVSILILFILKNLKYRNSDLIVFLFLLINCYLMSVSFINVSTPRYFMPIFPTLLIFIFLGCVNLKKKMINFFH